jgi:hypothetical protein
MILRAEICNALTDGDLEESTQGRCTHCCTRVEISAELAQIIAAWPSLSGRQRQDLCLMATSSGETRVPAAARSEAYCCCEDRIELFQLLKHSGTPVKSGVSSNL